MTQEEKQLLFKDLCARLPYGVKINHIIYNWEGTCINFNRKLESFAMEKDNRLCYDVPVEETRPYLRPMSSMTEEEYKEYNRLTQMSVTVAIPPGASIMKPEYIVDLEDDGNGLNHLYDWLNAHYFDYRGLIEKGLALEAPEGMYND